MNSVINFSPDLRLSIDRDPCRDDVFDSSVKESDLFPVLEKYFSKQGYRVQGEVCGCDLVALKGDNILIVELKKAFNVKLLYQAVRRLAITPDVYVAVMRPAAKQKMSYWQMLKSLSRRLQIGLLLVDAGRVSVLAEPGPFQGKSSAKKKSQLLKEFNGRKISKNVGGVTGEKINTAYLENAVNISVILSKNKILSAPRLRELGTNEKTYSVLYHNYYGWFQREGDGEYSLKPGKAAQIKKTHPEIWEYYRKLAAKGKDAAKSKKAAAKRKAVAKKTGKTAKKKAVSKKKSAGLAAKKKKRAGRGRSS